MTKTQETRPILLVDDNPINLKVLSEVLSGDGFEVAVAVDGENALEVAHYNPPKLILLDVQMPGMDGFETCQRLKSNPITVDIPVIFITALADAENKVKGLSVGAVDYITKPFEREEVLARVKIHLQLRNLNQVLATQNRQLKEEIQQRERAEMALHSLTQELEQRVLERTVELQQTLNNLQQAQVQLIQQEKMSSLGQLVAGVAHEINNPVGFIANNIDPAQDYFAEMTQILRLYQKYYPEPAPEITTVVDEVDLEFTLKDLPKILSSMKLGVDRIRNISVSLRNFSRTDTNKKLPFYIHEGLDSTLLILRHRLKADGARPAIEVIKEYGDLPEINCYPGQLNQVFMNLLSNAVDALEEVHEQGKKEALILNITTQIKSDNKIIIQIADNGLGIKPDVQKRIFEPLFTTKKVNKGTGLGLSISQQIIEEKHRGSLTCHSVVGEGTKFVIELPLL